MPVYADDKLIPLVKSIVMSAIDLTSAANIAEFRRNTSIFDRPSAEAVSLPAHLPEPDRRRISRRLTFYLSDCGCAPASLAMIVAILAWCVLRGAPPWAQSLTDIAAMMGTGLSVAVAVKVLALTVSHRLLLRELRRLESALRMRA